MRPSAIRRARPQVLAIFFIVVVVFPIPRVAAYSPTTVTWNPPGDTYNPASPSNHGVSLASPYIQSGFTITYNGYMEEDSNTAAFGTHWSGQVNVNFVRATQSPDNTDIRFARSDGSEFWLNEISIDLDATSTKDFNIQGFRNGSAVTNLIPVTAAGTSTAFEFGDAAFANIDEVRFTASSAIRGFLRPMKYHATPLAGSFGNLLSPGDIAIIAVSLATYDFAFIALADLPGDHYVFFTTRGWNSTAADWVGGQSPSVGDGNVEYGVFWKTPSGGVAKGTIVNYLNAPGEHSVDYVAFHANDTTSYIEDQILVFEKADATATSPNFIYAANFYDSGADASGFQTSFATNPTKITGLPASLTAAASGQTGSAFGLAPTNGLDSALKAGVLTDGMTRTQVLQAIHTPSNWEVYADTDNWVGFPLAARYPASIALAGGNSAPVLDASKAPALTAVNQTATSAPTGTVGTLAAALVRLSGGIANVTDSDSGALAGLALTGVNGTNGTWYFTTDGGANWTAVGPVSNTSALLLAADANTRVYFKPDGSFAGTISDALTFRAWDQTSGSPGTKVTTATNGSSSAFSTATDTASINVSDNVAPTVLSILRQLPSTAQATNSTSATFRVTFSEAINTPTTSNFAVAAVNSSSIVGTVNTVTSVGGSTSVYDVAVTITSGSGEFRLLVKD